MWDSNNTNEMVEEKIKIENLPNPNNLLNKISEMLPKCRHEVKHLLCNLAPDWIMK